MGFVSIEEVEPLMHPTIVKALRQDGKFTAAEQEAAIIVRDITGLAIPATPAERPETADWVRQPMAWIIQYINVHVITDKTGDIERRFEAQYKEAKKLLENHPLQQVENGEKKYTMRGEIGGMYE